MTLRLRLRRRPLGLRHHTRGQAMVETALAAPFVLMLLAGGAQVGSISYGQVTIDTAAREGARIASEHPVTALTSSATHVSFFNSSSPSTYTCNGGSDANIVCQAVYSAPGLFQGMFDKNKFTVVITANAPQAQRSDETPDDVQAVSCSGEQINGTVYNADGSTGGTKYDVAASGTGTTQTTTTNNGQGTYSFCMVVTATQTETISASYGTLTGCNLPQYYGSTQVSLDPLTSSVTANLTVAPQVCPTPTPTPTPTTSPTPTPSSSGTPPDGPLSGNGSTFTCPSSAASIDGTYITVKVSYPMPLFVPFVGNLFNNGGGTHTTTATVTMRVEPCGITQGT